MRKILKAILLLTCALFLCLSVACGHKHSGEVFTEEATCEADGRTYKVCADCHEEYDVQVIPALGHSYEKAVCSVCSMVKPMASITYTLEGTDVVITGIDGTLDEYEYLPETIEGFTVKKIGKDAFKGQTKLKNIFLSEKLEIIEEGAFADCTALETVKFPNSVKEIQAGAYSDCTSLKIVHFGMGITKLSGSAFVGCDNIESVMSESEKYYSASNCIVETETLTLILVAKSFEMPSNISFIGENALSGRASGTIVIPNGVLRIADNAFYGCDELTEIYIPDTVLTMGKDVFFGCENLKAYCEVAVRPSGWGQYWNRYDGENGYFDAEFGYQSQA